MEFVSIICFCKKLSCSQTIAKKTYGPTNRPTDQPPNQQKVVANYKTVSGSIEERITKHISCFYAILKTSIEHSLHKELEKTRKKA